MSDDSPIKRMKYPITLEHAQAVVDEVMVGKDKKIADLQKQIERLEGAVKEHRSQKLDDRCWMDDQKLYAVLSDGDLGDNATPPKEKMLENCRRYIEQRCKPGEWQTYQQLEQERDSLKSQLAAMEKNRDEHMGAWQIDRKHEMLSAPHPDCCCPSCNLHHKYQQQLAAAEAKGEALKSVLEDLWENAEMGYIVDPEGDHEWCGECDARNIGGKMEHSELCCQGRVAEARKILSTPPSTFLRECLEPVIKLLEDAQKVIDSGHFPTGVKEARELLNKLIPRNEETK